MSPQLAQVEPKPRLLFVDDEQRVLNSMRIMFRREFDLFLASHGAAALDIIREQDIDVIIADHRMPQMTGVEVLSKVRAISPRTVRILLTGYADLDAVEGSINDGEVFRFLTKPCAPEELREAVTLAARLARSTPAPGATPNTAEMDGEAIEIILESSAEAEPAPPRASARPASPPAPPMPQRPAASRAPEAQVEAVTRRPARPPSAPDATKPVDSDFDPVSTAVIDPPMPTAAPKAPTPRLAQGLGIVVFSTDEEVLATVQRAVRGRIPVHSASNIVQVVNILTERQPGVLVTDISDDKATIQAMTARLKQHLPELVTIAVSEHRDVLDMVWLINHGQIFRFLRKPLSPGRCAISLQAALKHHRMLLKNPDLVKRHEVAQTTEVGLVDGVLSKLKSVRRLWASV